MPAHPAFDADRWFEALATRRSRRAYDGISMDPEKLRLLKLTAETFVPFEDARAVIVENAPPDLFTGIIGSYGKVSGATSAIVFVVDTTSPTADEHCGYIGEGIVLEASALGLGTCWISGSFSKAVSTELVTLKEGEAVRAVSPVGRPALTLSGTERLLYRQDKPKFRRPLDEIAPGHESWPVWAAEGARAARVAPSAINRQPWRFRYENGSVIISAASSAPGTGRLDCGIAMLHFELGARTEGNDGAWVAMTGTDVARWEPFSQAL
jgi:hypothetical protein